MFKKLWYYLNPATLFTKKEEKQNFNTQAMHFINRVCVYMFLIALVLLIRKYWQ